MVEHVNVIPESLRGGGFLLEPHIVSDFAKSDCDLVVHNETIDDVIVAVFRMSTGTMEGYSVADVMTLIEDNFVKNLTFNNNQIRYTSISPEEITTMDDLNGVIVGLDYDDGKIIYDTFESANALLYDDDLTTLAGAICDLEYDTSNYRIIYDTIGEIND
jgi:hypothetical protein